VIGDDDANDQVIARPLAEEPTVMVAATVLVAVVIADTVPAL
jgi:hypothetical protein